MSSAAAERRRGTGKRAGLTALAVCALLPARAPAGLGPECDLGLLQQIEAYRRANNWVRVQYQPGRSPSVDPAPRRGVTELRLVAVASEGKAVEYGLQVANLVDPVHASCGHRLLAELHTISAVSCAAIPTSDVHSSVWRDHCQKRNRLAALSHALRAEALQPSEDTRDRTRDAWADYAVAVEWRAAPDDPTATPAADRADFATVPLAVGKGTTEIAFRPRGPFEDAACPPGLADCEVVLDGSVLRKSSGATRITLRADRYTVRRETPCLSWQWEAATWTPDAGPSAGGAALLGLPTTCVELEARVAEGEPLLPPDALRVLDASGRAMDLRATDAGALYLPVQGARTKVTVQLARAVDRRRSATDAQTLELRADEPRRTLVFGEADVAPPMSTPEKVGWVLVGTGAASFVGAGVSLGYLIGAQDDLDAYDSYRDDGPAGPLVDERDRRAVITDALWISGAAMALAGAAVLLWWPE